MAYVTLPFRLPAEFKPERSVAPDLGPKVRGWITRARMGYAIYNPQITHTKAIDSYNDPSGLTYVSNSSLAYWQGRYWAIVDGTTQGFTESSPGQQIWITTSDDGINWDAAIQPFRNTAYCNNPISGSALEWQPNLVVVGDELWCTWTGADAYISKLTSPTEKWTNYRFEFVGEQIYMSPTMMGAATPGRTLKPVIDGISTWRPFFTQNPIVLSSGVVACPLTLQAIGTSSSQTTATKPFVRQLKYNALFKTSNGTNWSMVRIDTSNFGDFVAWEPFVVEDLAGRVYVFSRNLDMRSADKDFMLVAISDNGGNTFATSISTEMLVPATRGFARQISPTRWVMTHVDHPQNSDGTPEQNVVKYRRNGAVFVSRTGSNDFVPGINFSGVDLSVHYPQFVVGPDDALYINYTSGDASSSTLRRSLRIVQVGPLPDDNMAYIHPRKVSEYTYDNTTDPRLDNSSGVSAYLFNGFNQSLSVSSLTATTGVTYAAWIEWPTQGDVLIDTRTDQTGVGQVLSVSGLSIAGLAFDHELVLLTDTPTFLAAVVNNTTQTVTLYVANGDEFSTKTCHYRSIQFTGQPSDGDTVTVDSTLYTFRASPQVTNDVAIGSSVSDTITNLKTALESNSMKAAAVTSNSRLIMTRTDIGPFAVSSGSSQINVETGIPLNGGKASFGKPTAPASLLSSYAGRIYEGRVYDSALTLANLTDLHNARAADFGYPIIAGTNTAPGAPTVFLNPASPNPSEFPPLGLPPWCEIVNSATLRIHGEGSASVELPYGATEVTIRYKLGVSPGGTDKYVIATFGTIESPCRLYMSAANPTKLYLNDRKVADVSDPTVYNTVTATVSTNKVTIGGVEKYFSGNPRCYLGNAFPEGLLPVSKSVDYDISGMTATKPLTPWPTPAAASSAAAQ